MQMCVSIAIIFPVNGYLLLIVLVFVSNLYSFFLNSNIVDASSMRDLREASAYESYALPKLYVKQYYCVEAAVHQRIVRSRSAVNRRIRTPPPRFQPKK
jgi:ribosomal protein S26